MNKLESVSSCSVFIVYLRLVYFFLKYLLEFTNETIWAWGFLCGKPFIFTQIFTISGAFHSFLKICISVDVIFLQLKELSLALLVVQFCWQWILSFLLSENVIISLSFLKNIFTRDRILKWPFFFFNQYLADVSLLSSGPVISDEKSIEIWTIATMHVMCRFSLAAITIFSLSLVFSTVVTICLAVIFFVFVLGNHWSPQICPFMFSQNGNFQPLYLQTCPFLPHALSPLLLELQFHRC